MIFYLKIHQIKYLQDVIYTSKNTVKWCLDNTWRIVTTHTYQKTLLQGLESKIHFYQKLNLQDTQKGYLLKTGRVLNMRNTITMIEPDQVIRKVNH